MFVDFDSIFYPTKEQKQQQIEQINNMIRKSLKTKGECCGNCKHLKGVNCGHGWMDHQCTITNEWIDEDIRCDHYEFCGFITGELK